MRERWALVSWPGILRRRAAASVCVASTVVLGWTVAAVAEVPQTVPRAHAVEQSWGSAEIPPIELPEVEIPVEIPPIELPDLGIPGSEGLRATGSAAPGPAGRTPPDCTVVACVALTFDDGPDRQTTPTLLDILEQRGVPATFFVLGQRIGGNEDILHRMAGLGMEVANHTWDHPDLTTLPADAVADQVVRTSDEITRATGQPPTYFRPPGGAWVPGTVPPGELTLTMWDVDPLDWLHRDPATVAHDTLAEVGPGDIVLLHDIHPTTVEAVPRILDGLAERGLVPVTLAELGHH